ncbi:MAG TPA: hypothetical protein VFY87_13890 [Geminicoccaceae bacterium]|nr:hypothetical protein [Geminicoccaceae bacterium]
MHDLRQAQAVLDLARSRGAEATLVTAPDSAGFAGVGFWRAAEQALGHPVVIDCGDDAGLAMAALREGSRDLLFIGSETIASKLASMAGQIGGRLRRGLDGPVLELLAEDDPARRLADVVPSAPLEADRGAT